MKHVPTLKTSKTNPFTPEQMASAISAAPDVAVHDVDCPETTADDWQDAVVSRSLAELRDKLASRGVGRPKSETPRLSTTIRYSPEVIAAFKATGKGWQTRMNDALIDWLKTHPLPKH